MGAPTAPPLRPVRTAMASVQTCLKFVPCLLYLMWHLAFMVFGAIVLVDSWALKEKHCGQATHMMKFVALNFVFTMFTTTSYLVFPGGGEGARARAIVIIVFHFAFAIWGILMWSDMSSICAHFLSTQYLNTWLFHHMGVVYHAVFFTLMVVHEAYLGQKLGSDFTLIGEFHRTTPAATVYSSSYPVQSPTTPTN